MVANVNQVVTLREMKDMLRIADEERDHDHMLQAYIYGSVKWFEKITGVTLVNKDFDYPVNIPYGSSIIDVPYTHARFRGTDVLPLPEDYVQLEYGTMDADGEIENADHRYLYQDRETVTVHIVKPTGVNGYYYIRIPQSYRIIPREGSMLNWEDRGEGLWRFQDTGDGEWIWQTLELENLYPTLTTDDQSVIEYGTLDRQLQTEYKERIYLYHNIESHTLYINRPIDDEGSYFIQLPSTYELVSPIEGGPVSWLNFGPNWYVYVPPNQEYDYVWQTIEVRRKDPVSAPANRVINYYAADGTLAKYEVPHDELVEAIEAEYRTLHNGRIYLRNGWRQQTSLAMIPLRRGMIEIDENLKALISVIVQQLYDGYIEIKMTSTLISLLKPYMSMRI